MANIKAAKKKIKVIGKKTAINKSRKSALKGAIKKFDEAVILGDKEKAQEQFVKAQKMLKQTATKSTIHANTAARKTSRMAKKLNTLA